MGEGLKDVGLRWGPGGEHGWDEGRGLWPGEGCAAGEDRRRGWVVGDGLDFGDERVEEVVPDEGLFKGRVVFGGRFEEEVAVFPLEVVELLGVELDTATGELEGQLVSRISIRLCRKDVTGVA